ncbi:hypothetical protein [Avibacterium avium]|uniref:hypothetical protein n=1 Tax=Avibacterium avium TaxID=751 RepID=UPI003BF86E71
MRDFLIRLLGGKTKQDLNFIRDLIKHWDEFREDSNLLLKEYPQIKEKEFWLIGHFDIRDKYFSHLYKLQNGKFFEEFEPLEPKNDGYINSLGHFLRKRNF